MASLVGPTPQDRIARPPNQRRHRGAEKASSRNERHPACDVLTAKTRCAQSIVPIEDNIVLLLHFGVDDRIHRKSLVAFSGRGRHQKICVPPLTLGGCSHWPK